MTINSINLSFQFIKHLSAFYRNNCEIPHGKCYCIANNLPKISRLVIDWCSSVDRLIGCKLAYPLFTPSSLTAPQRKHFLPLYPTFDKLRWFLPLALLWQSLWVLPAPQACSPSTASYCTRLVEQGQYYDLCSESVSRLYCWYSLLSTYARHLRPAWKTIKQ